MSQNTIFKSHDSEIKLTGYNCETFYVNKAQLGRLLDTPRECAQEREKDGDRKCVSVSDREEERERKKERM